VRVWFGPGQWGRNLRKVSPQHPLFQFPFALAISLGRYFLRAIAQVSCYTGHVERIKQNVTLVVDEALLLAARKVALDQRTSVNQLVREYLSALVEEPGRRRLARARLKKAFENGLVEVGDRTWSRNDLYDR
jgi:hypothetical protein